MSDTEEHGAGQPKSAGRIIAVVLFLLLSPLFYLLSAGPVIWLTRSSTEVRVVARWIYWPVLNWCYHNKPEGPLEQAYLDYLISWI